MKTGMKNTIKLKPIKHGIILVGITAGLFIGISFIGAIGFTLQTANAQDVTIPSYVKTIADFWQKHEVDDDTFTQAIEYLIEQDIVKIPDLPTSTEAAVSGKIPDWIRTTTKFYVTGETSDREFADSIGYLVGKGVIATSIKIIPNIQQGVLLIRCNDITVDEDGDGLAKHCEDDLFIEHVELTQVIQDMENNIPMVKGKETWVRVYVGGKSDNTTPIHITGTMKLLTDTSNPRVVNPLNPAIGVNGISLINNTTYEQRRDVTQTINFAVPMDLINHDRIIGEIELNSLDHTTMNMRMEEESNYDNNKGRITINFLETNNLDLNFHPVNIRDKWWCTTPTKAFFVEKLNDFALKILPVASINVDEKDRYDTQNTIVTGLSGLALLANIQDHPSFTSCAVPDGGLDCYVEPLHCLIQEQPECLVDPGGFFFNGDPGVDFGLVCSGPYRNGTTYMGMGFNGKAWAYPSPLTITHEIIHAIGVHHDPISPYAHLIPDRNAPNGFWNEGWNEMYNKWDHNTDSNPFTTDKGEYRKENVTAVGGKYNIVCEDSKDSHRLIGEILEDDNYPYYGGSANILHRGSIGEVGFDGTRVYLPEIYSDIMSYCDTFGYGIQHGGSWISPYTYSKLLDVFQYGLPLDLKESFLETVIDILNPLPEIKEKVGKAINWTKKQGGAVFNKVIGSADPKTAICDEWKVAYSTLDYDWRVLAKSGACLSDISLRDFDGDGHADIFYASDGKWALAESSKDYEWNHILSNNIEMQDIGFGNFDCDKTPDIFTAVGGKWQVADSVNDYNFCSLYSSGYGSGTYKIAFGNFDGDGKTDVFVASGGVWQVAESSTYYNFRHLATSDAKLSDISLGDFDGDGITDVIFMAAGVWKVAESGNGYNWRQLATSGYDRISDLAFGDFDGDGITDVFIAAGGTWQVADSSNNYNWRHLASSDIEISQMAFGNFDGDGLPDIFVAGNDRWQVAESNNRYNWRLLASYPIGLSDIALGNFDSDGLTDVFIATGSEWRVAESSNNYNWRHFADSGYGISSLAFGNFDRDGITDIFVTGAGVWQVAESGNGYNWRWLKLTDYDNISDLALGDYDGDGTPDVYYEAGKKWDVSVTGYDYDLRHFATSGVKASQLALSDFDGDGITDVFTAGSGEWKVAESGNGYNWRVLATSGNDDISYLATSDFDGDRIADVIHANNGVWQVAESGNGYNWRLFGTSSETMRDISFGYFDEDDVPDVFWTRYDQGKGKYTEWMVAESGNGYNWRHLADSEWGLPDIALGDFDGDGITDVFIVKNRYE